MGLPALGIDDLGVQLADGAQPARLPGVASIQRLPENVLPTGGVVTEIEPVAGGTQGPCEGALKPHPCPTSSSMS